MSFYLLKGFFFLLACSLFRETEISQLYLSSMIEKKPSSVFKLSTIPCLFCRSVNAEFRVSTRAKGVNLIPFCLLFIVCVRQTPTSKESMCLASLCSTGNMLWFHKDIIQDCLGLKWFILFSHFILIEFRLAAFETFHGMYWMLIWTSFSRIPHSMVSSPNQQK